MPRARLGFRRYISIIVGLNRHTTTGEPMKNRILLTLALMALASTVAALDADNNPYGIQLLFDGSTDTTFALMQMDLAIDLCGEWAYVRMGGPVDVNQLDKSIRWLVECRAMHLTPLFTAFRPARHLLTPEEEKMPIFDADGTLTTFSNYYAEWLDALYKRGVRIPYFEYGNEVNGGFYGKRPELYADMFIAASKGIKSVDPDMSFGTAGMAGNGADYYDELLTVRPELKDHADHWGMHPYCANHPPNYDLDGYCVAGHRWTRDVLKKHGVQNTTFMMSECGFELGNKFDDRFPKITEELRAEYFVYAFTRIWAPDPDVRCVTPFILHDVRYSGWDGWEFIRNDFSFTEQYHAIAALPKPRGHDWQPAGPCSVRGRVVDKDLGRGIPRMVVWIRRPYKGCYAAVTDANGFYSIDRVPEGTYTISAFRDTFDTAPDATVELARGRTARWDGTVARRGFLHSLDGDEGRKACHGWTPGSAEGVYAVDRSVYRGGASSQRVKANGTSLGLWNIAGYESCLPWTVYTAEVWVKGQGVRKGSGRGATLTLSAADTTAVPLGGATYELPFEGDFDWTPMSVAYRSQPEGRRVRVDLEFDAEAGTVWFDDLFVHEGAWPVPSAYGANRRGGGSIAGEVLGPDGRERLRHAIVCINPLGLWAETDMMGRYAIEGIPPGAYHVSAYHERYSAPPPQRVTVSAGAEQAMTFTTVHPRYRREISNADFENIPWLDGWLTWGATEGVQRTGWHSDINIAEHPDGFSAHGGEGFYGAVAGSNVKDGGIYQTLEVDEGATYELSVWSYTYTTSDGRYGDVANRIGIDPRGGDDPASPYVIWTPLRPSEKEWTEVTVRAVAQSPRLTVFLHHLQVHGIRFNCNLFDDVTLRKVEE